MYVLQLCQFSKLTSNAFTKDRKGPKIKKKKSHMLFWMTYNMIHPSWLQAFSLTSPDSVAVSRVAKALAWDARDRASITDQRR